MKLISLPAFVDNAIWMLHDGHSAWVVDPGDETPVQAALDRLSLRLAGILVTHHHADHVGGIAGLRSRCEGPVVVPAAEPLGALPGPLTVVDDGDRVSVLGRAFQVLHVPGHTIGHVAYASLAPEAIRPATPSDPPGDALRRHIESDSAATALETGGVAVDDAALLFCGDTLFSAGCGRLFEGTPAQMRDSLARLAALPADTRVCCAHEYTVSNLRFAAAVEPDNAEIAAHLAWATQRRQAALPTLPSRIGLEHRINPFLRSDLPQATAAARARALPADTPTQVFASLREWKNQFR